MATFDRERISVKTSCLQHFATEDCQMDKLNHYRQVVQLLLLKYAAYKPAHGEIEVETIFDMYMTIINWLMLVGTTRLVFTVVQYILILKTIKYGFNTMALK